MLTLNFKNLSALVVFVEKALPYSPLCYSGATIKCFDSWFLSNHYKEKSLSLDEMTRCLEFKHITAFLRISLILIVSFYFCACEKVEKPIKPEPVVLEYSFFVAGHTYGGAGIDNVGLHPPMEAKFGFIKSDSLMEFGVLTGDIVISGSTQNWDDVDASLALLEMPVYFAAGNHDLTDRPLYESRYGLTYYTFEKHGDLFIVLDPSLDNWNISGDQLTFIQNTLNEKAPSAKNIYVFFHQLLWWSPDNIYKNVQANSVADRDPNMNFWTEVEPLFNALPNNVIMFAGDVGKSTTVTPFMYHHYDNITFIASGMGNGVTDNFVIVDVWSDKSVTYRLISLNTAEIDALGKLVDYVLP